jgi:WD40 repeat protein
VAARQNLPVTVWDVATGKEVKQLTGDRGGVRCAAFAPGGKVLAVATELDTIQLWDIAEWKLQRSFQGRGSVGALLEFSPDGKRLAAGGRDGSVQVWDTVSGKRLASGDGPGGQLVSLAFLPEGGVIACGVQGQALVLWEVTSGKRLTPTGGHQAAVGAVAFTPDGKVVYTAADDGKVFHWDTATGKERASATFRDTPDLRRGGMGERCLFSPDGRYVVSSAPGGVVRLRECATGQEILNLPAERSEPLCAGFSADGGVLAVGCLQRPGAKARVVVYDTACGEERATLKDLEGQVYCLALSPDGKSLAVGTLVPDPQTNEAVLDVRLWDAVTGKEARKYRQYELAGNLPSLAFSPNGRLLAVGLGEGAVSVLEAAGGRELCHFQAGQLLTAPLVFSPDSRTLAVGAGPAEGQGVKVGLWEVFSGKLRRELSLPHGGGNALAFSPDGKVLATGGSDTTTLLWDLTRDPEAPNAPTPEEAWANLALEDAAGAHRALLHLAAAPTEAVPLIRKEVPPAAAPKVEAAVLARLLADLDHDTFEKRQEAVKQLQALGRVAEPALRQTLKDGPPLQVRRLVEQLLEKLEAPGTPPELWRPLRAVEVLERIGTAEARRVLEALGEGDPDSPITREANASVRRLAHPPTGTP